MNDPLEIEIERWLDGIDCDLTQSQRRMLRFMQRAKHIEPHNADAYEAAICTLLVEVVRGH